ncbi:MULTISPECIES: ABC transporter substrate-binding protein [Micromonospora]|uniref:Carbohydrate ABC transporter substrate-binding protein, CUT1 family (TC 3.A.1.1.-) n=1 Tax=Micromonospora yangpuensis TaxID=683228 RepID=A0A1C6UAN4_9ACTN|nr:extracellular solute-binding protein [Micromonospora yangpuensis]GGL87392.1 ABC transporter substrate-binding protein [Micromonospora yangpuensis]SCL51076.1 carbohydrate ABC transporter substrate-binding protein, CUT1 family (TC 3.A.1.1.-) [Micromonospora yangpuensis]
MTPSWTRWARAVAVGAISLTMVAACSGSSTTGGSGAGDKVTLRINFWGDFGLDQLKTKYEAANTNVRIVLNSGEYNAQHEDLQKKLVAGSGAPDIAAIDEGFMVQFRSQADQFVNLLDKGAASYESKYLPWKWKQSLSADGKTQIALGTDVGGLAMCYRSDLFAAAGLPTERDQVSALWPTWDRFIEVGRDYTARSGKKFIDSGTNLFNPILGQQPVGFYDEQDQLRMEGGPKVAFDYTMRAQQAGISANLTSFQTDWNRGFTTGAFAVLACPAWMLGHIKETAPTTDGKWDIAAVPGGGGNWGGSFLTIPKQSKNPDEAYRLLEWLVQPEQQIEIFKQVGNLPSQPGLYTDPAITEFTNPFFGGAPVGQIFPKMAQGLTPQYLGRRNGPTRVAVEQVIGRVQNNSLKADAAWAEAVKAAEKAATS